MPPALDEDVKNRVWRLWLLGETRKNIAETCGIGAGSVTNIINERTKGLDSSEYGAIRDLAVQLKKENMTFAELASMYRRHNYIGKMGANEEEIEVLIANLLGQTKFIPIEKTANLVNQLYELSKSESIPPAEVPSYVTRKMEEKQRVEQEIQKAREILDQENVQLQTIEEYKKLEDEFKKYGLSMEDPRKLISVLQKFDDMGYDSQKIVTKFAHIKSLGVTERRLKKSCKILESRAALYQKIIPMCEYVDSRGEAGLSLLMALQTAVLQKIELEGVPAITAPFRVMQDIKDCNRLGGMKKQLFDTMMQLNLMKEFLGRQNDAINTFMKLRLSGMTEDQIFKTCRSIERNGHDLNGSQTFPVF